MGSSLLPHSPPPALTSSFSFKLQTWEKTFSPYLSEPSLLCLPQWLSFPCKQYFIFKYSIDSFRIAIQCILIIFFLTPPVSSSSILPHPNLQLYASFFLFNSPSAAIFLGVWGHTLKVWGHSLKVWGHPLKLWGHSMKMWGHPLKVWGHSLKVWCHPLKHIWPTRSHIHKNPTDIPEAITCS